MGDDEVRVEPTPRRVFQIHLSHDKFKQLGTTIAQENTLLQKWEQHSQGMSFPDFVDNVFKLSFDDCVMVKWQGMWLGIEKDGYSHT